MKLSIVTFYWHDPKAKHHGHYEFGPDHVNKLARGFRKHLKLEHDFVCITDNPAGIDTSLVRIIPLWDDFRDIGRCFTRLKVYSEEMEKLIGNRFACIDLDVVLVNDVTPIFNRTEPFIGYRDSKNPTCYSGALYMMDAGVKASVYKSFNRLYSMIPQQFREEHFRLNFNKFSEFVGSDQSWQTEVLGKGLPKWTADDGIYDYWTVEELPILPANARIVFTNGMRRDVSMPAFQRKHPWIMEHWVNV